MEGNAEALRKLLASTSGALALLNDATEPASTGFRNEVASAGLASTNMLVRELLQRLLPHDQRRRTLGSDFDPQAVLTLKGDQARGKDLFLGVAQCSRCHVSGGVGRVFGPDLTDVARKYNRAQLLEEIMHPSKLIAPEYKTVAVLLNNESELSGFVLKRSEADLVLRDENLERQIKLVDVKSTRLSDLSAMPEGLLAPLTAQEAADLLEFFSLSPAKN